MTALTVTVTELAAGMSQAGCRATPPGIAQETDTDRHNDHAYTDINANTIAKGRTIEPNQDESESHNG